MHILEQKITRIQRVFWSCWQAWERRDWSLDTDREVPALASPGLFLATEVNRRLERVEGSLCGKLQRKH